MRIFLLVCLSFLLLPLFSVPVTIDYSLETEYSDNIWHLSDYDRDRAEAGSEILPFVDTIDDFVIKSDVKAELIYKLSKKVSIDPFVKLGYDHYTSNTDKSKSSILTGVQVNYKPFSFNLEYGYYPDTYVRDYKDNDNSLYSGTGHYEKFEYDKNLYKVRLGWRPMIKHRFFIESKLEDYCYNEYFTEYDGTSYSYELGWRGSFPGLYLDFSYTFKEFTTDDDIESLYTDEVNWDIIPSDSSYESDTFDLGLTLKKVDTDWDNVKYRFTFDFAFDKRYYQGGDEYHNKREDTKSTVSPSVIFYLGDSVDIHLDYSYCNRTVESPYNSVPRYKEYSENTVSIGFGYKFDLLD